MAEEADVHEVRLSLAGEITETSEGIGQRFPDLEQQGLEHRLFRGIPDHVRDLGQSQTGESRWTTVVDDVPYELTMRYTHEDGFTVRIVPVDA